VLSDHKGPFHAWKVGWRGRSRTFGVLSTSPVSLRFASACAGHRTLIGSPFYPSVGDRFVAWRDGRAQLYVYDLMPGAVRQIVGYDPTGTAVSASIAGSLLAFTTGSIGHGRQVNGRSCRTSSSPISLPTVMDMVFDFDSGWKGYIELQPSKGTDPLLRFSFVLLAESAYWAPSVKGLWFSVHGQLFGRADQRAS